MTEADETEMFIAINHIKNKVDSLEKIELHRMRNDSVMRKQYEELLLSDSEYLKIYKAINGERTQAEIADEAKVTPMQVTRKLPILVDKGLIEIYASKGKSKIYIHTVAEKAFRLTRLTCE